MYDIAETNPIDNASYSQNSLTAEQIKELIQIIEQYIYGGTHMCEALRYACNEFQNSILVKIKLYSYLLTDKQPTAIQFSWFNNFNNMVSLFLRT